MGTAYFNVLLVDYLPLAFLLQLRLLKVSRYNIFTEKDEQEWGTKVINALYISTCRVSDGPCIEDTDQHALHLLTLEHLDVGLGSQHVYLDLLEVLLFELGHLYAILLLV